MKPVRSTLLTVLCILTMVASAYGIISSGFSIFMANSGTMEQVQQDFEKANKELDAKAAEGKEDKGDKIARNIFKETSGMFDKDSLIKQGAIGIGVNILTLLGAILMFKLNKIGFYIYVAGKVVEIVSPFLLFGSGFITGISVAITGFIGVIFIVLYAFCLKEMKPQEHNLDVN